MITVYDAINSKVPNIPKNVEGIAYYVNGSYAWSQEQIDSFPTPFKISIAVTSNYDADFLDVETGDATPADIPRWMDRNPSKNKGIYCNQSTWPTVQSIVGLKPKYWIAAPGPPVLIPPAIARQYAFLGIYDVSVFDPSYFQGVNVPSNALPQSAYPITHVAISRDSTTHQLDVLMTGSDGHVYHKWYTNQWNGPDIIDQAV